MSPQCATWWSPAWGRKELCEAISIWAWFVTTGCHGALCPPSKSGRTWRKLVSTVWDIIKLPYTFCPCFSCGFLLRSYVHVSSPDSHAPHEFGNCRLTGRAYFHAPLPSARSLVPLRPPPTLHQPTSSLNKQTKKPLKKVMFPNLHEIFYHMMCLAFRK